VAAVRVTPQSIMVEVDAADPRFVVEQFTLDGTGRLAVAASDGSGLMQVTMPAPSATAAFYRVIGGLQPVFLADPKLEAAIRGALGGGKIGPANWLYDEDINQLSSLALSGSGLLSLAGLDGQIRLHSVDVGGNALASLAGAEALSSVEVLRADGNALTSLEGLGAAPNLAELDASHNEVQDLGPLSPITTLRRVYLDHNRIQRLDALAGLTSLEVLDLSHNAVTDIGPLLDNAAAGGLGEGDVVYLVGNPITDDAGIVALRSRGVTVIFP
jgi:Leucine-rich repeat (LRR) protein